MPIFRRKNCIHTASDEIILYYDARSKKHQIHLRGSSSPRKVSRGVISQKAFMLGNSAVRTRISQFTWLTDRRTVCLNVYHSHCVNTIHYNKTNCSHTKLYYNNPYSYMSRLHEQPSTNFTFPKYMICESTSGYGEQRVSQAPFLKIRQQSLVGITQRYAAAGLRPGKDSGHKTNTKNSWPWQLCLSRIPRLKG